MIGRKNWKFIAIALLAVALVMPRAAAQEDGKEIAKLRAEIAKLREEVKQLKDALTEKKLEGPTFRGKSIDFWLERLNDADPQFRGDAFAAVGGLIERNRHLIVEKKLVTRMIDLLDESDATGQYQKSASAVLGVIGSDAIPALTKAIRDKRPEKRMTRRAAIHAIANIRPRGKEAILALIDVLKDDADRESTIAATRVLSTSGLNAKEALPALIENLDQSIRESASSKMPAFSNKAEAVLVALVSIEPDIIDALPQKKIEVFSVGPRPGFGIPGPGGAFPRLNDYLMARLAFFEEAEPQWRQAINNLKKRYRVPK